jgi:hypothetical protein
MPHNRALFTVVDLPAPGSSNFELNNSANEKHSEQDQS